MSDCGICCHRAVAAPTPLGGPRSSGMSACRQTETYRVEGVDSCRDAWWRCGSSTAEPRWSPSDRVAGLTPAPWLLQHSWNLPASRRDGLEFGRPIAHITKDLHPPRGAAQVGAPGRGRHWCTPNRLTTDERERLKALERQNRELRKRQRDPQGRVGVFRQGARSDPTEVSRFADEVADPHCAAAGQRVRPRGPDRRVRRRRSACGRTSRLR